MSGDDYLKELRDNVAAIENGSSPEELMPLLQWLANFRPSVTDGQNVEYMTTADIQTELSDIVTLDLNAISTVMWRLGYRVSVALTHPAWAMMPS